MNKFFKIDSGQWLDLDESEGVGRSRVSFTSPAWEGREDRYTLRVVKSGKNMKAVTIRQKGIAITEISTDRLDFPIGGGDKQIMIKTNAASLNALITSENNVKGFIKAFTTASGLNIDVNDKKLNYGFAGDPGLKGVFDVSLIVSMPDNSMGEEVHENITINGKLIRMTQPGRAIPYIRLDKEFEEVANDKTSVSVSVESNLDNYNIEIIECDETEQSINVDKEVITLDAEGNPQTIRITTNPKDLAWRIEG